MAPGHYRAASAIGVLNRLDRQKIIELINISSNFSLTASRKTMPEGGTVRNFTGISNQMAHLAYQILQAGRRRKRWTDSVFGNSVSSGNDTAAALDAGNAV